MTTRRKSFGSDNHAGAHPEVIRAIADANSGDAIPYGADQWTARTVGRLRSAFRANEVFLVFNGTAANALGISLMLRPFEAIICAETSHMHVDECGATERLLGNKLLVVPTPDGKLTPDLITPMLTGRGDEHRVQPRVVEIAQVTELGTCYTLDELTELREFCDAAGLYLYMDGARLASAAAYLDCELAEIAAHADVLSFGGTKNGAVAAEAVVVMHEDLALAGQFHRKQLMQLGSKMRFIAAQFAALLDDGLWLRSAQHANAMARLLASGVDQVPGVSVRYPVQANAVFAELPPDQAATLQRDWTFHVWSERESIARWMTAFDTTTADVEDFVSAVRLTSG